MVSATEKQVKERPILFSGSMIRAILEGRKTQTRRVIPEKKVKIYYIGMTEEDIKSLDQQEQIHRWKVEALKQCPYGSKGDRLWCKETFCLEPDSEWNERFGQTDYFTLKPSEWEGTGLGIKYLATEDAVPEGWQKYPSIFMPRSASRINLIIKNIRVEKLQEITEEDAIAEGIYRQSSGYWTGGKHPVKGTPKHMISPVEGFKDLWNSINADRGYSWDSNPFVWVIEFEREAK